MGCTSSKSVPPNDGGGDVPMQGQQQQQQQQGWWTAYNQDEIEKGRARLVELEASHQALQTELNGARDTIQRNTTNDANRIAELESRIATLQKELEEAKKPKAKKKKSKPVAEMAVLVNNANNTSNNDAAEIARLNAELQRAKQAEQAALQAQESLRKELGDANAKSKSGAPPPAIVVNSGSSEEKLRADLAAERKLVADLRKELTERTKASLASAASGSQAQKTSSTVVIMEAAEYMKMNEIQLRSQIEVLNHEIVNMRQLMKQQDAEIDRLNSHTTELNAKISEKSKSIHNLTLQLSEVSSSNIAVHDTSGLDSAIATMDAKSEKLDSDMELTMENLRLQATVNRLEEELASLKGGKK